MKKTINKKRKINRTIKNRKSKRRNTKKTIIKHNQKGGFIDPITGILGGILLSLIQNAITAGLQHLASGLFQSVVQKEAVSKFTSFCNGIKSLCNDISVDRNFKIGNILVESITSKKPIDPRIIDYLTDKGAVGKLDRFRNRINRNLDKSPCYNYYILTSLFGNEYSDKNKFNLNSRFFGS